MRIISTEYAAVVLINVSYDNYTGWKGGRNILSPLANAGSGDLHEEGLVRLWDVSQLSAPLTSD